MKSVKIILLFLPLILSVSIFAQGNLDLTVKVFDSQGRLIPNATVSLVESSTNATEKVKTNSLGIAKFNIDYGKKWNLFINGLDMEQEVRVPDGGMSTQSITKTYDKKIAARLAQQNLNRTGFINKTFNITKDERPPKGYTSVQVRVKSRRGTPHPNMKVMLINHKKKLSYTATTDAYGKARFLVPYMNYYDIDVENSLNSSYQDLRNSEYQLRSSTILFEKYYAKEIVKGDTVFQDLGGKKVPCSTHAYFKVKVMKDGIPLTIDMVYLQEPKTEEAQKEYKDLLAKGLVQPTDMEIYTCNVDGSDLKKITSLGNANWAPFYHPSGNKIIFSSNHTSEKGFPFNLYMINADGTGEVEQITHDPMFASFPMFSYDGKKLVFSSNRNNGGTRETNLFVADWVE